MQTCDDCFNEFEPHHKLQDTCDDCLKEKYSVDQCVHIWKVCCSCGFKSQEHIDKFQNIKLTYNLHTGKTFTQITEKVGKKK